MSGARKNGACLCGAVRVEANLGARGVVACQCNQCRRWTGGGPYYSTYVEDVIIDGDEHIALYAASEWGERGFCKACGSTLFWRMKDGAIDNLAAGLFDDQSDLKVTEEIFCDRRAPWQMPFTDAKQSTEAEEFAKLDVALTKKT